MQVLTPTGYRDASTLAPGDEVCAFDAESGAPIINHVEAVQSVDYTEWCRWWQVEETVRAFNWIKVNGSYLLFREQSLWRNGTNVCHASDLIVGDEIYDDADQAVTITSVETIADESLVWYRFDIDGDHSYILDGLTVHNASRFWVGGTGTWDASTTTHWAASSGGAGGQSVPGASDTVTFDGNSGGGTVTPNYGGTITVQSITGAAFTGTLDFSVNNNSVTLSATSAFNFSGTSTKTLNLGDGTWTLTTTAAGTVWTTSIITNLTFNANNSTIVLSSPSSNQRSLTLGNLTYHDLNLSASGAYSFSGLGSTFNTLTLAAGANLQLVSGQTVTVANLVVNGTKSSPCSLMPGSQGSAGTISCASGAQFIAWIALRDVTFTGGATFIATNSFDLGNNSGVTITAPGGGSFGVVGG